MINSVDIDRSGFHGILFNKDVTIFNLIDDRGGVVSGFEGGGEYTGILNRTKISGKANLSDSSCLNAIFTEDMEEYGFESSNIVKFGIHPRVCSDFICIRGGTVLHGNLGEVGMEYISTQIVNITSFDWSPHYSTGTFVTASDDALIRISDLRTKGIDYSFLSFYNTTHVKWSSLNSFMIATMHENCSFMSIYDLRTLKSMGIIPKIVWNNNRNRKGDVNTIDFEWIPFTSNKIVLNQIEFMSIIDISSSLSSFKMVENSLGNLCQTIDFAEYNSKHPYIYSNDNVASSVTDSGEKLIEEKGNLKDFKSEIGEHKIKTFSFVPETNCLIVHNELGNELYYCNLNDTITGDDDNIKLKFSKTDIKLPSDTFKIFIRNSNLFAFASCKDKLKYDAQFEEDFSQADLWLKKNISFSNLNSSKRHFFNLKNILLDWFVKDVNLIHGKIKNNNLIANNISHVTIESNGKIIMSISKHPIIQNKFVFEDNTKILGLIDDINSFEFSISLNISKNKSSFFTVKYYVTENTVQLINIVTHKISIYSNTSYTGNKMVYPRNFGSNVFPQENTHACIGIIPMRIFIDGAILEKKELGHLYEIFEIKVNEKRLSANDDCLLDWVSIISSWPRISTLGDNYLDEDLSERFEGIIRKLDNSNNIGTLEFISVKSKLMDNYFHSGNIEIKGSTRPSTKFSFAFKNFKQIIISKNEKLFFIRLNDDKLEKGISDVVEKLICEIDNMLADGMGMNCRMNSILKNTNDNYFSCAYVLLNWLIKTIYDENKNRQVVNTQNYYIDLNGNDKGSNCKGYLDEKLVFTKNNGVSKIDKGETGKRIDTGSFELLLLGPTLFHSLLNDKFISIVNRNHDVTLTKTKGHSGSVSDNIFYSNTLFKNKKIDKSRLISILKKLHFEIENNYNSRIMVVSIGKLLNYLNNYKKCSFSPSNTEHTPQEYKFNKSNKKRQGSKSDSYLICSVCNQYVYGLYTSCLHCKHGGHMKHIKIWFDTMGSNCPVPNCNCKCTGV
ncbi:hypothetical protein FG386_000530 [Cryptosporidium ryanae]|uniref:uncharacterized protein n=1 Tax=Cryptosporidium ryanae TaxID=515981 RepID=UPI00351A9C74|nr:hypothetical protein FG386_000530 [Cryptosporidium ryanae]